MHKKSKRGRKSQRKDRLVSVGGKWDENIAIEVGINKGKTQTKTKASLGPTDGAVVEHIAEVVQTLEIQNLQQLSTSVILHWQSPSVFVRRGYPNARREMRMAHQRPMH
uniref:Uncharacterized protein n=1 Tax=Eutreptiella gymnastica TaxID=73025 RepID=A0A7S4CS26_9EUGL|mmetsp:Transcript_10941/g.16911  ORF Transcript_10941/g.16911 Transcript_10941/m.16911 type:complete len:109 (-) Transcript_10941:253-579(-)